MAPERFGNIMASVAQRMRAEFNETAAVNHRGGKGATREEIVQDFLKRYVPGQVEVTGRGEIITADEQVSPECDAMIVDKSAPRFMDRRDYRIVPAECVQGIVEVKSRLDGRELLDACEKIKTVKSLPKIAYAPPPDDNLRQALFHGRVYSHTPTAGLIFAFDSINLEELGRQFADWCGRQDVTLIPDGVWILGEGSLQWLAPNGRFMARPDPDSNLSVIRADPEQGNLLYLTIQLNALFAYSWMRPLDLQMYASFGSDGVEIARWGHADRVGGDPDAPGA